MSDIIIRRWGCQTSSRHATALQRNLLR